MNVLNPTSHSAHCRACKESVRAILTAIYGECRVNHQFAWPARPEAYADTIVGNTLKSIYEALGDWRGHRDFAKSALVPPCDFYLTAPPFILEFDESQHFSQARLLALRLYPKTMQMGFSLSRWQDLCREINAVDDQPVDRDERRAWYDTLRDLVPIVHGFKPTVRLYAGEVQWCAFNAANETHLETLKPFLCSP